MKTISYAGKNLHIHGRDGDPYFDNLNIGDKTNDFLMYCKQFVENNSNVFDVGANIGLTSSILATCSENVQVYAFEPGPETFPVIAHAPVVRPRVAADFPRV